MFTNLTHYQITLLTNLNFRGTTGDDINHALHTDGVIYSAKLDLAIFANINPDPEYDDTAEYRGDKYAIEEIPTEIVDITSYLTDKNDHVFEFATIKDVVLYIWRHFRMEAGQILIDAATDAAKRG